MTKSFTKPLSYRKTDAGEQRGRVVKSAVIVIEIVLIQSLLRSFCCVLVKDTLQQFSPVWQIYPAVLNFSHIFIKLKNQNKKLQPDSNISASPEADRGNYFSSTSKG